MHGCEGTSHPLTLHAGPNTFTVDCPRTRAIQGIIRMTAGGAPSRPMLVACPSGNSTAVDSFLFTLRCPAGETELLFYDLDEEKPRRKPIAPGVDPVLVELTL